MAEPRVFQHYARYYDILYRDKDYAGEVDYTEAVFRRFASAPVRSILDVGSGTGTHALLLARRGYEVTGVDPSPVMVASARAKAEEAGLPARFLQEDARTMDLGTRFDAATCYGAVLGYLADPDTHALLTALRNIRRHLRPGGLFLADVWNGLGVLHEPPTYRFKVMEEEGLRVIRLARPVLRASLHLCEVHYRLLVLREGRLVEEVEEVHRMRFFFPQELAHYLEDAGFFVVGLFPAFRLEGEPDERAWHLSVVARARTQEEDDAPRL